VLGGRFTNTALPPCPGLRFTVGGAALGIPAGAGANFGPDGAGESLGAVPTEGDGEVAGGVAGDDAVGDGAAFLLKQELRKAIGNPKIISLPELSLSKISRKCFSNSAALSSSAKLTPYRFFASAH